MMIYSIDMCLHYYDGNGLFYRLQTMMMRRHTNIVKLTITNCYNFMCEMAEGWLNT